MPKQRIKVALLIFPKSTQNSISHRSEFFLDVIWSQQIHNTILEAKQSLHIILWTSHTVIIIVLIHTLQDAVICYCWAKWERERERDTGLPSCRHILADLTKRAPSTSPDLHLSAHPGSQRDRFFLLFAFPEKSALPGLELWPRTDESVTLPLLGLSVGRRGIELMVSDHITNLEFDHWSPLIKSSKFHETKQAQGLLLSSSEICS